MHAISLERYHGVGQTESVREHSMSERDVVSCVFRFGCGCLLWLLLMCYRRMEPAWRVEYGQRIRIARLIPSSSAFRYAFHPPTTVPHSPLFRLPSGYHWPTAVGRSPPRRPHCARSTNSCRCDRPPDDQSPECCCTGPRSWRTCAGRPAQLACRPCAT